MPSYLPMPREPPIDTEYPRNLGLQFPQGPPLHPNLQMSSYLLRESGFQMPQQPARDIRLQVSESHLVAPGIPVQPSLQSYHSGPMSNLHHLLSQRPLVSTGTSMQLSFQWHPVPTGKLSQHMTQSSLVPTGGPVQSSLQRHQIPASHQNLQMSQSPLVVEATSTQSNFQWHLDPERDIGPQVSPGPSMKTSPHPPVNTGLPLLATQPVNPSPQLPSCSPGSPGFEDSLDSLEPSDTYSNQKVPLNSPERKKKTRTVYSKREKELLQEYFSNCPHPSPEKHMELAQKIGVTKQQIQIWFKNQRAKNKRKNASDGVPETSGSCEGVSESTSSCRPLSELASADGESMSPAAHSGQPKANEAPTDPAVAEGTASAESPLLMASAPQEPEDAQDSDSSSEKLWQQVLKDLDAFQGYY
ncbi:homeobox protein CDX-2-like [Peromyscus eremicus]|uniref:homeobox protein CDX-2-like n=1 Tax=Peromyscus eremicus TaxID=42410 RepID=UPI0027DBBC5D|nr:homeobox protein CDX-2-like [Peromyscus eremicus]